MVIIKNLFKKIENNSSQNGEHSYCEAVKVDMAESKSKKRLYNETISSTLSCITVLFEDVCVAYCIHKVLIDMDEVQDPPPSISLLNKADKCVGYLYEGGMMMWDECNALQIN